MGKPQRRPCVAPAHDLKKPTRPLPTYTPTPAERQAIERGRAQIGGGEYVAALELERARAPLGRHRIDQVRRFLREHTTD